MRFFLNKITPVQLDIIYQTKHILFFILGRNLHEASASSCLFLVTALRAAGDMGKDCAIGK